MTGPTHGSILRCYLGDAVYVAFDGFRIVLSAENGVAAREIVLEPEVWTALVAWVEALARARDAS
jgi:hypothetical protein